MEPLVSQATAAAHFGDVDDPLNRFVVGAGGTAKAGVALASGAERQRQPALHADQFVGDSEQVGQIGERLGGLLHMPFGAGRVVQNPVA